MDYKYIEQLLERYFECATSLQEESILRSFFSQNDVPEHLRIYQELFRAEQEQVADAHLSADFDERIMSMIDAKPEMKVVKAKQIHMAYRFRPIFKSAAVVAIILSFSLAVQMAMYRSEAGAVGTPATPAYGTVEQETAFKQNNEGEKTDTLAQLSQDEIPQRSNLDQ